MRKVMMLIVIEKFPNKLDKGTIIQNCEEDKDFLFKL